MKKYTHFYIIVLIMFMSQIVFAQVGWNTLASSYTGNFRGVYFINTNTGYAVGGNNTNGVVYKTTNGGAAWSSSAITGSSLESVWFVNSTTGYVAGSNGKIYKTTNSGSTWLPLSTGSNLPLKDIQFPTASVGYAVGLDSLLKTSNTGSLWTASLMPSTGVTFSTEGICFTSASNGVAFGSTNYFQGWIRKTTNGGANWSTAYTTAAQINDIYFSSSDTGYAAGNAGGIYKTTNGGNSWIIKTSGFTGNLNAVFFINSNNGFAVGDSGVVLKTIDGGTSWMRQNTSVLNTLQSVWSPSSSVAYVVGDINMILKTITSGVSLILNAPDDSVYCQGYANLHAYVTYDGTNSLTYTWNASPLLSSTTDSVTTAGPLTSSQSFVVTVSDGVISQSDTAFVNVIALPTDSICLVAVDSLTGHPIVVFEKVISGPIDYYNIYRESTVAGIYDSIASIDADSIGVYMDTAAYVVVRSYSYVITNVDSCGNESAYSNAHKTMHLQISAGAGGVWNLLWTPYQGVFVQSYEIWRGTDSLNMSIIGTVPGSNTSYSDLTPPSGGLYYFVRIVSAYICHPTIFKGNTDYNSSRSGKTNNGIVNPPLNVGFSATPLNGTSPLLVQFTDGSIGNPVSWNWYFGDGDTSSIQNPSHIYTTDGLYTVKLVVHSSTLVDSIEKVGYISVNSQVSADFTASPLNSSSSPLNVHFQDASTGNPTSWMWHFGDGNTSTSQNPSYTYNAIGKYTVKLIVSNGTSQDSIMKVDYINVGNVGVEDIDFSQFVKIYPNPTRSNSFFYIEYSQVKIRSIELVNIVGKKVAIDIERTADRIQVETSGLSNGIYILKLTSNQGSVMMRKIIVR